MRSSISRLVYLFALSLGLAFGQMPHLVKLAHFPYRLASTGDLSRCDYVTEPCAALNDIWGYEFEEEGKMHYFAIIGLTNGIDIVDVTDPTNPQRIKFVPGCINSWRDFKVWNHIVYGITEYTATCNCEPDENCVEHLNVTGPANLAGKSYVMTEGRLTPQLSQTGPVEGEVVPIEPWSGGACDPITNGAELEGKIALIPTGTCFFHDKILQVQNFGAKAAILVNSVDSVVYPGMTGTPDGIEIPGVLIGLTDGMTLRNASMAGEEVTVMMSHNNLGKSPFFRPPEGLTRIDMTNPWDPVVLPQERQWFNFSHNLFIEWERPYMYVCGMSDRRERQDGFADIANGGMFIFDVSDQTVEPQLIATWNTTYIHDMYVHVCDGTPILFAAGIYDDYVFVIDVTDPANPNTLLEFHTRQGAAHNVVPDETCSVLYVTHEIGHEPVTVWRRNQQDWSKGVKYLGSLAINQFYGTLPHNVFVEGQLLWSSYYSEGVAVWSIDDPTKPLYVGRYDTSQFNSGFHGVWGVYPYANRNGIVYGSDIEEGLFVLRLQDQTPSTSQETTQITTSEDRSDSSDSGKIKSLTVATSFLAILSFILFVAVGALVWLIYKRNRDPNYSPL